MPMYHALGELPPKRHTQFRGPDDRLYVEEVFGLEGFSGNESILYHRHSPCRVTHAHAFEPAPLEAWNPTEWAHRHLQLAKWPEGGDPVRGRQALMFNNDVVMSYARPTEEQGYWFRNGQADELIFVHEGEGTLRTIFGPITYGPGDYLVVPRGTIYKLEATEGSAQRHLVFETPGRVEIPKEFRNRYGQLLEHAPYYHRDIRRPGELETIVDDGSSHELVVKINNGFNRYDLDYHPLDVVGWDGYCYPWALNIKDYEPKAGRIHQPPTSHLTFRGPSFVVCSFVPRMLDWDENAIPVPYHHSNLDSEEVIYYVDGNFISRKGIDRSSVTLHPSGLPHGPQPGAVEASLGAKFTDEWAVMIDTFKPLQLAKPAEAFDEPSYKYSWASEAIGERASAGSSVG